MSEEMGRYLYGDHVSGAACLAEAVGVMRVRAPFRVRRRSNGSVALYAYRVMWAQGGGVPSWDAWVWGYDFDSLLAHRGSWLSWRDGVGFE
jgi:hypothetical protein